MVNTSFQAPVPLTGTGFKARPNGNYLPGEYKRLTNVEIEDQRLRNRRSMHSPYGEAADTVVSVNSNPFGFIGSMGTYAIYVSATTQTAVGPQGRVAMWAPTSLPVPAAANSFHKIVGYFRYNNVNYWITLEFNAGTSLKVCLYSSNVNDSNDTPGVYTFAGLTRTEIITVLPADLDFNKFEYQTFFIQGERLWVVTSNAVYFSKATDPKVFAVPNGGFFKFPDQKINWAMSVRNQIYVLCDNSVTLLTYTTDPNQDSNLRRLSDNMGGERGCIHQDTPYIINNIGVYAIVNGYLNKIIDNEFDVGKDYYHNSIAAFGEYLIINKFSNINYEKFDATNTNVRTNLVPNPSLETNATGYSGTYGYMQRLRDNSVAGYVGAWQHKCTKVNDLTQNNRINYITNPSFELNTANWTTSSGGGPSTLTRANTGFASAPDGTWVGKVTADATPSGPTGDLEVAVGVTGSNNATNIAIAPSRQYYFRTEVRLTGNHGLDLSRTNAYVRIIWKTAGGATISTSELRKANYVDLAFKELRVDATSPSNAAFANLYIEIATSAGGIVYNLNEGFFWDACTFSLKETANAREYYDGDSASVGTTQYDYVWEGTPHASRTLEKGLPVGTDGIVGLVDYVPNPQLLVTPGTSYTAGAAFKAVGVRDVYPKILYYDSGGALLSTSTLASSNTVANTWTYITKTFTPPASAHHISVQWLHLINGANDMAYNEVMYVDALTVEATSTYNGYFDGDTVDTAAVTYAWTPTAHATPSTATLSAVARKLYLKGRIFDQGAEGNSLGYNVYFLNTSNGAVHVMDFVDCRDTPSAEGFVVDVFVNYYKDTSGNYNCFFLTNKVISEDSVSWSTKANSYFMNTSYDVDLYDYAVTDANVLKRYAPKIEVEVDSFAPDVANYAVSRWEQLEPFEYLYKKYRTVAIMGKMPNLDLKCSLAFDNEAYGAGIPLIDGDPNLARPHFPYRVPINQRARSVSLKLHNENSAVPLDDSVNYGVFEVSDIRLLWSKTLAPSNRRALIK